jgi:hypothetical protein
MLPGVRDSTEPSTGRLKRNCAREGSLAHTSRGAKEASVECLTLMGDRGDIFGPHRLRVSTILGR